MNNFNEDLAELLEVDDINPTDRLESFESWDSLTILSIIAYTDDKFNIVLSAQDVTVSETVEGLYNLIKSRI